MDCKTLWITLSLILQMTSRYVAEGTERPLETLCDRAERAAFKLGH